MNEYNFNAKIFWDILKSFLNFVKTKYNTDILSFK